MTIKMNTIHPVLGLAFSSNSRKNNNEEITRKYKCLTVEQKFTSQIATRKILNEKETQKL